MVIPCLYHLEKLPKLIKIGWGVGVSEPKFTSEGVKAEIRHEPPQAIGTWMCLLIKGGDNPKIPPIIYTVGEH